MDGMRISIAGDPRRWRALLDACLDQASDEIKKLGDDVAEVSVATLKQLTPKKTGYTANAWYSRKWSSGRGAGGKPLQYNAVVEHPFMQRGAVHPGDGRKVNTPNFKLIDALEYGTRSHEILPAHRTAKGALGFLRFVVKGKVVFTRRVVHPGTKAYGMIRQTAALAERFLGDAGPVMVERLLAMLNAKAP